MESRSSAGRCGGASAPDLPPRVKPIRTLLLYARSRESETLSYQRGWPRHLQADRRFDCTPVNVLDRTVPLRLRLRRPSCDAVVALHSVFSNACYLGGPLLELVRRLSASKVYFIGNEYKLMPEKTAFADQLGVDLLVSQLTSEGALQLYRERLGCKVVGIPNTGLDPALFAPRRPRHERPIDVGYRGYENPLYLGHAERHELAGLFVREGPRRGLTLDVSLNPSDRFTEPAWAGFLNRCKGQLGSEAGGDYFELTDATRKAINAYLAEHPEAGIEEVRERFFRDYPNPVLGRALSGRIVEAAGTKTVQILLEGEYGGYFEPDVHYIPLGKDFADLDEAISKFRDASLCEQLTENAYEVAAGELTYPKLIDRFHDALASVL